MRSAPIAVLIFTTLYLIYCALIMLVSTYFWKISVLSHLREIFHFPFQLSETFSSQVFRGHSVTSLMYLLRHNFLRKSSSDQPPCYLISLFPGLFFLFNNFSILTRLTMKRLFLFNVVFLVPG